MRYDTWDYHSRASLKHRYLTVATPKVGCTTIKRTLHALEGLPPADPWWAVHDEGEELRLEHYSAAEQQQLLTSRDITRFAFVRNPYDRLLSAWKSKILRHDSSYVPLAAEIRAACGYPDDTVVAFGDFVRYVTTHEHPDAHWERQVVILACDRIAYDVVGRFENFAADFRTILLRLGVTEDVLALAGEVTNPTPDFPLAVAYDTELANVVYDYYREDFERFGYDADSWFTPR
ncbi:MAG TPA: sulfotransferase family protein [Acidimicrobiales bacterium]|nr:sulfotransferase family protein [Acidimicrobiales bacterium]